MSSDGRPNTCEPNPLHHHLLPKQRNRKKKHKDRENDIITFIIVPIYINMHWKKKKGKLGNGLQRRKSIWKTIDINEGRGNLKQVQVGIYTTQVQLAGLRAG